MKLTGGAKEQFDKWFNTHKVYEHLCLATFQELPLSMQWGVIQDFSDSLGIELYVSKETPLEYVWAIIDLIREFGSGYGKTRQEARNAAIEKLNEIINEG